MGQIHHNSSYLDKLMGIHLCKSKGKCILNLQKFILPEMGGAVMIRNPLAPISYFN